MKKLILPLVLFALFTVHTNTQAQNFYTSSGGEVILSGSDVQFNGNDVNNLLRFTIFFHFQYNFHFDFTDFMGVYTGLGIRNVGLIMDDYFQNIGFINIDQSHPNYNKSTKVKKRSFSIGAPIALKLGDFGKDFYLYGGGEYEYMFHYKQKLFLDGNKSKYKEWGSKRVTPWNPSFFVGVQFPKGINLKFKYYLEDFLNSGFTGSDFGYDVDYSQFESSKIWYVSLSYNIKTKDVKKMVKESERSAFNILR